jgi:hypothetical protein
MSPEQAMERPLDQRSDLFSLGTLLFHLVTGQLPFTGSNPSIILRNIIDGNRPHVAELVPDISDSFADTIERLLQSDPGDRQVRASDALEDLRQVLADVGIDHTDERWSLQRWMLDPDTYEAQLQEYLRVELLSLGQARLAGHNHLEALRLFNRLLSMDEDNEEVLSLIQGMHNLLPEVKESEGRRPWWLFAITMPMAAGLLTWALWPEPPVLAPAVPAAVVEVNPPELVPSAEAEAIAVVETDELDEPDDLVEPIAEVETAPQVEPITKPVIATPTPRVEPSRTPTIVLTQPPTQALPGQLTVLVPGAWGDIFIDDVLRGRTGQGAIEVKPGTHTLRVENDYSLPHIEEFTIDSDSERTLTIPGLKRKPATVDIRGRDGSCEVYLDGTSLGTAAGLGYRFQLSEPDRAHTVELRCGDGNIETHEIDGIEGGSMVPLGQR